MKLEPRTFFAARWQSRQRLGVRAPPRRLLAGAASKEQGGGRDQFTKLKPREGKAPQRRTHSKTWRILRGPWAVAPASWSASAVAPLFGWCREQRTRRWTRSVYQTETARGKSAATADALQDLAEFYAARWQSRQRLGVRALPRRFLRGVASNKQGGGLDQLTKLKPREGKRRNGGPGTTQRSGPHRCGYSSVPYSLVVPAHSTGLRVADPGHVPVAARELAPALGAQEAAAAEAV
jgi:hypothetical protein